jgi:hypothetical protein
MVVAAAVIVLLVAAVAVKVIIRCPSTGLDRPLGLQEVEDSQVSPTY